MKWAESADGMIAGPAGRRVQISNRASSHQVQLLRSRSDAIVVGINTVLHDDPVLLPRDVPMLRPYQRIVLDNRLQTPLDSRLIKTVASSPVNVHSTLGGDPHRAAALADAGARISSGDQWLQDPALNHILIEPGPTLARGLFTMTDRLWVIRSPRQ